MTPPSLLRKVANVVRGSLPGSPVAWSTVVMLQRLHVVKSWKFTSPMRMRLYLSSANAGQPPMTTLGRKRFIGTGS
jgi:hypothetical protein